MKQKCDLRWKFKTEKGDIGFGVQRRECVQPVLSREEVSAYHIMADEDPKKGQGDNIVTINDPPTVPEIQINDDFDGYVRNHHNIKIKYQTGTKDKRNCAVELLEEVDEMGSFVEDQTIHAETVTKVRQVKIYCSTPVTLTIYCDR